MQIGEVAELLGLSLRSIRYYGEMELAPPSARSEGGFRLYGASDVARLRLIMEMKPLGFSLDQMRDLLDAQDQLTARGDAVGCGPIAADLLDRVTRLHDAAQHRVTELADQLTRARAFAAARAADLDRLRTGR